MKYALLNEFETLLKGMETALIENDVKKVAELTSQEQVFIMNIMRKAKTDHDLKEEIRKRTPRWMRQLEMNHKLIRQAMSINNEIIHALYGYQASY